MWLRQALSLSCFLLFCASVLGQTGCPDPVPDPAISGKWEFLDSGNPNLPVRWRVDRTGLDMLSPHNHSLEFPATFGINTVLLFNLQKQPVVLMSAKPVDASDYLKYSSYLLWNPYQTSSGSLEVYGRVGYFDDPMKTLDQNGKDVQGIFDGNGMCILADGRLLSVGGERKQSDKPGNFRYGLRTSFLFDQNINQPYGGWLGPYFIGDAAADNHNNRYKPSVILLNDGRALVQGGWWDTDYPNYSREYFLFNPAGLVNPQIALFEAIKLTANQFPDHIDVLGDKYPRIHLLSSGKVAYAGPKLFAFQWDTCSLKNGSTQTDGWAEIPRMRGSENRFGGASVLLPNIDFDNPQNREQQALYEVLALGGAGSALLNSAEILDFRDEVRYKGAAAPGAPGIPSMCAARIDFNAVLLPNGKIVAIGGAGDSSQTTNVLETEEFDPAYFDFPTQQRGLWTIMARMDANDRDGDGLPDGARKHHSSAILLPTGKILAVSTNEFGDNRFPALFTPPYLFKSGGRPMITSPAQNENGAPLAHGQLFILSYTPSARPLKSIVMLRPGAATHGINLEQRLVKCKWEPDGANSIKVTAPWSAFTAPPGDYMLFLVDTGDVYSEARWYRLTIPNRAESSRRYTGDVNGDCCVNDFDLAEVIFSFGSVNSEVNIVGDEIIDDHDLAEVIFSFLFGCE